MNKSDYPYVSASRFFQKTMKFILIVVLPIVLFIMIFSRFIVGMTRIFFDGDYIIKGFDKLNDLTDGILNDFIERDWIPRTHSWGDSLDGMLTYDSPLARIIVLLLTVFVCYLVTIVLRHHAGEIQPMKDDVRAYMLKRDLIDSLNAKRRSTIDEDSKKLKKLEKEKRKQLRAVKISVHTVLKKNLPTPVKYYHIDFSRHKNEKIHNNVVKQIKESQSLLSALVPDSNFGQMTISSNKKVFSFEGHKSINKAPEALLVKLRRILAKDGLIETKASEYVFPLDLFEDRIDKIEEATEGATEYALSRERDVTNILSSEGVAATLAKEPFVGNTSVRYDYELPERVGKLPNTEELENKIENSMKINNVRVELASGNLQVTIPLPKDLNIMIDTRTLIESTY